MYFKINVFDQIPVATVVSFMLILAVKTKSIKISLPMFSLQYFSIAFQIYKNAEIKLHPNEVLIKQPILSVSQYVRMTFL